MFKVLILARNKNYGNILQNMIKWEEYGFSYPQVTTISYSSLYELEHSVPDLIIMDAHNSNSENLELIYQLRKRFKFTRMILITSAKTFEIAQVALDVNIDALLSWNEIDADILSSRLVKVREYLDDVIHNQSIVKRQLFRDILKGKIPTSAEISKYFQINDPHAQYVIIRIDRDAPYPIVEGDVGIPTDYYAVNWHGSNFPEEFKYIATVNTAMHSWCTILMLRKITSSAMCRRLINEAAYALQNSFKQQFQDSVSVVYSLPVSKISVICPLVNQMDSCLKLHFFYGKSRVMCIDEMPVTLNTSTELFAEELSVLDELLQNNEEQDVIKVIASVFSYLRKGTYDISCLRWVCDKLMEILDNYCKKKCISSVSDRLQEGHIQATTCYCVDDIFSFFTSLCSSIMRDRRLTSYTGHSQKVQAVIDFLEVNYAYNDSTTELANKFHTSSDYLRHIFKKETGENLVSYISDIKIKKAKMLLSSRRYRVNEISEMVGFNSPQYFGIVFKKKVGCTPKEYQEQYAAEPE